MSARVLRRSFSRFEFTSMVLVIALGLAGLARAGPAMLTADQIKETIVGNTASGVIEGTEWAEYYLPNGLIAGSWGGDKYQGNWSVKDGMWCLDYSGTDDDWCGRIAAEGDRVFYYTKDGKPDGDASLAAGNPNNLAPVHAVGSLINKTYFGGVAIEGYDPVAYFTMNKAVKGSKEFVYDWLGATWYFASAKHRGLFAADAIKYAPQYGGNCSSQVTEGDVAAVNPEAWRIVDGKLYLIFSKDGLAKWEQDARSNIAKADAQWERIKVSLAQ